MDKQEDMSDIFILGDDDEIPSSGGKRAGANSAGELVATKKGDLLKDGKGGADGRGRIGDRLVSMGIKISYEDTGHTKEPEQNG